MSRRPNLASPAPIQDILQKVLTPADLRQLGLHARLRHSWEQAVSAVLRKHTHLADFKRKTLYVEVDDSPWMQELHFLKPRILAAMQRDLGEQVIRDITFRLK
ncbi:MAG: DUF721 domain-containing protein [Deltaproteobacteria bacterium]|nr:DUF721 domain-containing protein [Deltaproteobacteria bacterium]